MSTSSFTNTGTLFGIYAGLGLAFFGITGNIVNIYLLYPTRSIPSSYLLFIASFFNIITLGEALLQKVLSLGFSVDGSSTIMAWCKSRFFVSFTVTLISLTCVCLASIDRFFVTCRSAVWRNRSKLITAKIALLISIVVITSINVPILIYTTITETTSSTGVITRKCSVVNPDFVIYQNWVLRPILPGILPGIILGITGWLTYRNVASATGQQLRDTFQRGLTSMVLLQIIVIVIPLAPFAIMSIYQPLTASVPKSAYRVAQETLVSNITNILLYISYASNFYVYLISAPSYRQKFLQLFKCCYHKNHQNNRVGTRTKEQLGTNRLSIQKQILPRPSN
ncbi:unnamed protein product [Adineta steineri]|uniref:G-protein coupled receptors family 1 profile domain-containing protein n=1 Tax=Adineta steineri TaxID=433720 RepID=A0A816GGN2_9BILA|nr:unnamed protein product [Adineta steineri]CAF1674470.1 unnamed protein product [Adineta steineri]